MKNRIFLPLLLLAGLMPFHNLIVQYSTKVLGLPELVVFWKDWVLAGLIFILLTEIFGVVLRNKFAKMNQISHWTKVFLPIFLIVILNIITVLSSFIFNPYNFRAFLSGYYFELWWLDFFALLATWFNLAKVELDLNQKQDSLYSLNNNNGPKFDEIFEFNYKGEIVPKQIEQSLDSRKLKKQFGILKGVLIFGFLLTGLVSLASFSQGQEKVLGFFGYANNTQSQGLVGNSLVCHPIDYQVNGCRLSGTMSHPIHYAAYLLLILPILLVGLFQSQKTFSRLIYLLLTGLNLWLIFETYSRYALLSLPLLMVLIGILFFKESLVGLKLLFAKVLVVLCLLLPLVISLVAINLKPEYIPSFLPKSLVKPSSTSWHYYHLAAGIKTLETLNNKAIIGVGMGQSGSAARTKYQDLQKNILYKDYGKIAYDYNLTEESFLLVENWYLQTILNNGWIYGLIYMLITLIPLAAFWRLLRTQHISQQLVFDMLFGLGFFAVIIGNQLEHLWENQTVVILWVLVYFYTKIHKLAQK